jgi:hypothetical protein
MIEYNIYMFLFNISPYFEPERERENSTDSAFRRFRENYGEINQINICKMFGIEKNTWEKFKRRIRDYYSVNYNGKEKNINNLKERHRKYKQKEYKIKLENIPDDKFFNA